MFYNSMNYVFKVWELYFIYKGVREDFPIYVIFHKKSYIKSIELGKRYIKEHFDKQNKIISIDIRDTIRETIVTLFDQYYIQPFASIDYGYSITVDKSQGSTFESVYIDAPDILDQNKYPFLDIDIARRRFYTAITRASQEVNILI